MTPKVLFVGFIILAFAILIFSTIGLIAQGQGYVPITAKEQGILGLLGFRKKAIDPIDARQYQNIPLPPDEIEKLKKDIAARQATMSARELTKEATKQASPLPTTSASPVGQNGN